MELRELQKAATELIEEFDAIYKTKHDSSTTMLHLVEEFGELARELYNEKSGRGQLKKEHVAEEIADIYLLLAQLAKCYDIEVGKAVETKISELKERHEKYKQKATSAKV